MNTVESKPRWALVQPRAGHWYHVSRVIFVDGAWWELYWHPDREFRGKNKAVIRADFKAWNLGLTELLPGIFRAAPPDVTGWSPVNKLEHVS